ncbi:hypothetical protein RSOL_325090 [Rhizoctonia solani AG-3 Rhs1AP]|uniref:F-box domain-containing protein n=2 Tax=Rhizoctonia solani TaxID=456999 RepID=A0A0A1UM68_9AGAM|nr:hypothetical protein RSOL_325090 [Rhizoctonia solani AG-3 Rhs1AP]
MHTRSQDMNSTSSIAGGARVGMSVDRDLSSDSAQAHESALVPPSRKRPRDAANTTQAPARKKQVRGKQGRLAGLMNMPIDIFTEITSYLLPVDIISLSRSNKFFRNMLMHRSSIHIWHETMRNVEGLPPCPPNLSEPQYLTLLFVKTCSKCGKAARGKLEGELRMRLCGTCRNEYLVPIEEVPATIRGYVPRTGWIIVPGSKRDSSDRYALSEDVVRLVVEYDRKKRLVDKSGLEAWCKEKAKSAEQEQKEARTLSGFSDSIDRNREKELDALKKARCSEIERRVKELGWTQKDIPIGWRSETYRAWNILVNQPRPLTERIWINIQPKLVVLLETNRVERLEKERQYRKIGRQNHLLQFFMELDRKMSSPAVPFAIRKFGSRPAFRMITHVFPSFAHTLAWPLVKDLYETDLTPEAMKSKLDKHRHEIEALVTKWRTIIRTYLVDQAAANGIILRKIPVFYGEPNLLVKIPDSIKPLLRADSLFYTTPLLMNKKSPLTFSSLLANEEWKWSRIAPTPKPLSLEHVFWYPEAHEVAKTLLIAVGKPDASYLEMDGSKEYLCGRCHETDPKTWVQMVTLPHSQPAFADGSQVQHYVEHRQIYFNAQKDLEGLNDYTYGLVYNDIHDPALQTGLSMIKPYIAKPKPKVGEVRDQELGQLQICKVCETIPSASEVVTNELAMLRHLLDVHVIVEPQLDEHYALKC